MVDKKKQAGYYEILFIEFKKFIGCFGWFCPVCGTRYAERQKGYYDYIEYCPNKKCPNFEK
jgi:hypothetical protein